MHSAHTRFSDSRGSPWVSFSRFPRACLALLLCLLLLPTTLLAQPFRFMDEAGNLHWADSIDEVPHRYRNQILVPTPVPTFKRGRPPPPKKTKRPRPTKKPRLSLHEKQATKRALMAQPQVQPQSPDGNAANSVPGSTPVPAPNPAAVRADVAFTGAEAESGLVIIRRP
jgi:hypothetical protein